MPDNALALHLLVPGANYNGAPGTTKGEYESITWLDQRPKPEWSTVAATNLSVFSKESQAIDKIQSLGIVALLQLLDEVIAVQMEQTAAIRGAGLTVRDYTPEAVALWTEFHARLGELNP